MSTYVGRVKEAVLEFFFITLSVKQSRSHCSQTYGVETTVLFQWTFFKTNLKTLTGFYKKNPAVHVCLCVCVLALLHVVFINPKFTLYICTILLKTHHEMWTDNVATHISYWLLSIFFFFFFAFGMFVITFSDLTKQKSFLFFILLPLLHPFIAFSPSKCEKGPKAELPTMLIVHFSVLECPHCW